jgi:hypothetical protein
MAYTAGFSVNVGDPTKASDVTTLAANDDYLKTAVDKIMADAATPSFALRDGVTATTQSSGNNSTKLATTAYADAASISFANDANNRVVTGTGSGLNGEANLTFDGSTLTVGTSIAATADTNTSIGLPGSDVMTFSTGGTEALRINDEGVLGIKTTPAGGWHTDHGVLQIGTGALWVDPHDESAASNMLFLSNNLYRDSADEWRHIVTDEASRYYQYNGEHYFDTAPSGSAGAAASFTNRLKIDSAGAVGIGTTSPGTFVAEEGKLVLAATNDASITIKTGTAKYGQFTFTDSDSTADQGSITYNHDGDYMAFSTALNERMRILSGGGLTFNGDTATANALDDYEEGTFSPVLRYSTSSYTSSDNSGRYIKIGRLVWISANITITNAQVNNGTDTLNVQGLPFTTTNETAAHSRLIFTLANYTGGTGVLNVTSYTVPNTTQLTPLKVYNNGASWASVPSSEFYNAGTTNNVFFTGCYFANA